jgi:heme/copper-type cytochrome/quinol oxidase subunit 3
MMSQTINNTKLQIVSNQVLGVSLLVSTEVMFFTGLISAFLVTKSQQLNWPPGFQQRFPVGLSLVNMVILLLSGITMFLAIKSAKKNIKLMLSTLAMGLFFVIFQGIEWLRLLEFGLHSSTNIYGSFFYLIIGAHGLHVLGGLIALMLFLFMDIKKIESLKAMAIYWIFVVALWPLLYFLVYLS